MRKIIFPILYILSNIISNSQCVKGDCQNGEGTYKYERGDFVGVFKNGDAFKRVFTNTMFSEPIIFEGHFIDTDNGPVLDSTKKGKMIRQPQFLVPIVLKFLVDIPELQKWVTLMVLQKL